MILAALTMGALGSSASCTALQALSFLGFENFQILGFFWNPTGSGNFGKFSLFECCSPLGFLLLSMWQHFGSSHPGGFLGIFAPRAFLERFNFFCQICLGFLIFLFRHLFACLCISFWGFQSHSPWGCCTSPCGSVLVAFILEAFMEFSTLGSFGVLQHLLFS